MRKINKLCIHHSGTPSKSTTLEAIRRYHMQVNKWSDVGYHYVILYDGTVEKGRPVEKIGAHVAGKNSDSIGICMAGNFEKEPVTEAQASSLRALLVELKRQYPEATVTWHRELAATLCPGRNLIEILTSWRAMGII